MCHFHLKTAINYHIYLDIYYFILFSVCSLFCVSFVGIHTANKYVMCDVTQYGGLPAAYFTRVISAVHL